MPWCDTCNEYQPPKDMNTDGSCPTCGTVLATKGSLRTEARALGLPGPGEEEGEAPKVPWHFKLLMAGVTIYLGWRLVQGIIWLVHKVGS
jgi:predicted RNA-binding Zn-ribbon protein involved in translation (DUF1610 family)